MQNRTGRENGGCILNGGTHHRIWDSRNRHRGTGSDSHLIRPAEGMPVLQLFPRRIAVGRLGNVNIPHVHLPAVRKGQTHTVAFLVPFRPSHWKYRVAVLPARTACAPTARRAAPSRVISSVAVPSAVAYTVTQSVYIFPSSNRKGSRVSPSSVSVLLSITSARPGKAVAGFQRRTDIRIGYAGYQPPHCAGGRHGVPCPVIGHGVRKVLLGGRNDRRLYNGGSPVLHGEKILLRPLLRHGVIALEVAGYLGVADKSTAPESRYRVSPWRSLRSLRPVPRLSASIWILPSPSKVQLIKSMLPGKGLPRCPPP